MSIRPPLLAFLLACLLALSCLCAAYMPSAADAKTAGVEFTVWSRTYTGKIGGKNVEVQLERTAGRIKGSYCYAPCSDAKRQALSLVGTIKGQAAQLGESDTTAASPVKSGAWAISFKDAAASGTWTSPNGQRQLPIALTSTTANFPYEIRLVADALPVDDGGNCPTPPAVSEIRLYRDGKLVQALPTESQGTCSIFTPEIVDMNFDGHSDVMIAQDMPADPNISYDMWLYDAAAGKFVPAPASLTNVTSPEFDAVHHKVWDFWRSSCCDHGVDVYEWKNGELSHTDSGESYVLPVRANNADYYCYITPDYADGHVNYPDAVRADAHGKLTSTADLSGCTIGTTILERTRVDVWKQTSAGTPVLASTQGVTWKKTQIGGKTLYCPVVPFFEDGKIQPALLTDDPDLCSADGPKAS